MFPSDPDGILLAVVQQLLNQAVETGVAPTLVAVIHNDGGAVFEGAAGTAGPDSVFRLASMTKILTTVAALQLPGLDLDAPVADYRPEFADVQVLEGFGDDDAPILRPPRTPATVRQLITHTSGLAYWFYSEPIARWERVTGTPNVTQDSVRIFEAPLAHDPGTGFTYGIGADWLGRVIEAVTGQPLDVHLRTHLFQPLGLTSTGFDPHPEAVPVHVRDTAGGWRALPARSAAPEYPAGGHGVYSTPRDFMRFQRTLLDRPELFVPQVGFPEVLRSADRRFARDFVAGPGHSFGLGLLLDPAGRGSWWGLFNTHFWVDPRTRVTGAVFTQTLPFLDESVRDVVLEVRRA